MKESDYSFDELIHNKSFRRWVHGNATQQEKYYWDKWVMRSSENRALAIRAQQHIAGFSVKPSSQPAQNEVWSLIKSKMEMDRKYIFGTPRNTVSPWFFRVAAAFLLVALTGLAIGYMTGDQTDEKQKSQIVRNEVVTEYGERKTIDLSDGSKIILNAHSSLVYAVDPADSNAVEVFLNGEAHFSIAKRELPDDAAFKVKTPAGAVKVMGTQFVVSTRNRNTQVILEEGKVALSPLNRKVETILKPGQLAEFGSDSDTVYTEYVNPAVYTSWTTYTLVFDRTPFTDIIDRLEHTFGVNVVVREPQLYERKLSGSIENSSLEVITSALSDALNTSIQVTGKVVYVGEKR